MRGRKPTVKNIPYGNYESHNRQLANLIRKFGARGYGIFWLLTEQINNAMDRRLQLDDYEFRNLAIEFHDSPEMIKGVIEVCCLLKLFKREPVEGDEFILTSPYLEEKLEPILKHKNYQREYHKKYFSESDSAAESKGPTDMGAIERNSPPAEKEKATKEVKKDAQPATLFGDQPAAQPKPQQVHWIQQYVIDFCQDVKKLKRQLTYDQCNKIDKKYPNKDLIVKVLKAMENKASLLKDYKSVYLTLDNWLEIRWEKMVSSIDETGRRMSNDDYIPPKNLV